VAQYGGEYVPSRVYTEWARSQTSKAPSFNYIYDRLRGPHGGWPGVIATVQQRLAEQGVIEPPEVVGRTTRAAFSDEQAWAALEACIIDHDGSAVSVAGYRDWARGHSDRQPSAQFLLRRLGEDGWTALVQAAQRRLRDRGIEVTEPPQVQWWAALTEQQLWDSVTAAITAHNGHAIGASEYRRWARAQSERVASLDVIYRRLGGRFGGWTGVVDEALRRLAEQGHDVTARCDDPAWAAFTDEQVWDSLVRAVADVDGGYVPAQVYRVWAQEQRDLRAASMLTVYQHFRASHGGWPKIMAEAQRRWRTQQPGEASKA